MNFNGLLPTLDAFLPYPIYHFVGGPCDGQQMQVDLIDLGDDRGYIAPYIWRVSVAPPLPPISFANNEPIALDSKFEVATYRFVMGRHRNSGYYKFVAD